MPEEIKLPEFKPEKLAEAFAAFPPKLSAIQEVLAEPERVFEEQVAATTGVSLPPGPNRILLQLMQTIEAGAPALPGFAPPFGGGAGGEGAGEQTFTSSTGSSSQKSEGGIDV